MQVAKMFWALFVFAAVGREIPDVSAQEWPTKPVRIIESFPAGIARDHRTRVIADKLSALLGQQVFVENRPGAAGRMAAQAAVSAPPDGYTFNMMGTTDILTKHLYNLSYDLERDLVPITMIEQLPGSIVVRAALPAKSVADVITYAKARPGEMTYGSTGPGGWLHVSALLFASLTSTNLRHVPYGQGNLTADLVGGHIDMVFDAPPSYLENIRVGNLRVLAVTGEQRASELPDVPTFSESDLPAYDVYALYGMFAPRGMPEPIIAKMQQAIAQVLREPALRRQWISEGGNPVGSTGAEFAARIRSESERWGKIIHSNNIKLE
jgi:tripartite-type tricarboxylate transporter receptor subunit TctC